MRDEIEYLLHVIEREGGWRAFALNLITLVAIWGALYGLTVIAGGMQS
jgi:hypothetical protein